MMEERKFRTTSLRAALLEQISDFIDKHPRFVSENPEYDSVSGFIDKSARIRLQELKLQFGEKEV